MHSSAPHREYALRDASDTSTGAEDVSITKNSRLHTGLSVGQCQSPLVTLHACSCSCKHETQVKMSHIITPIRPTPQSSVPPVSFGINTGTSSRESPNITTSRRCGVRQRTVVTGYRLPPRSGYHDWQVITRYDASAFTNWVINNDATRLLSDRYAGTVIIFRTERRDIRRTGLVS
ncbi:hypothetical protein CBL_07534 [Carabus blaptoides fortunei]